MPVGGRSTETGRTSLQRVRTAYRETVMPVPHFDAEYGDSLWENVAIEFGVDIASQVTGDGQLTQMLREVHAGLADCEQRAHALGDAATEAQGDELIDLDTRFAALEETCDDLAAERQRVIHRRGESRISGITGDSLAGLLYADLETTCPALREIARCVDTIRSHRRRCLR